MRNYRIILPFFMTVLMAATAHGQENPSNYQTIAVSGTAVAVPGTVSGTVTNMDFVGNVISIMTSAGDQMSFFVPASALITRDTHSIGLMDVKVSHPVTIKYETTSPGKDVVDSIVDNKPITSE